MRQLADLAAAWDARPWGYSRAVWTLVLALDALPWPWGEEILARGFVARAFVRVTRLRRALAWAGAQPSTRHGVDGATARHALGGQRRIGQEAGGLRRWSLACSVCRHQGLFVARSALIGVRDPEALRRIVVARGEEHLAAAGPGAILLGFHLGPAQSYLVLRALGHQLTWVGGRGASPAWAPSIRDRFQREHGDLFYPGRAHVWERRLYKARQLLVRGEHVFISADGGGTEAFSVPLPGGRASLGAGWWFLRRNTKAPALPVLSHLEGRTQVVTIHPPLPPPLADPALDTEACREAIGTLLAEHVKQFPEQCYSLVFGLPSDEPPRSRQ